jgi:poly(3-hydroxybutyrate) depolymerase
MKQTMQQTRAPHSANRDVDMVRASRASRAAQGAPPPARRRRGPRLVAALLILATVAPSAAALGVALAPHVRTLTIPPRGAGQAASIPTVTAAPPVAPPVPSGTFATFVFTDRGGNSMTYYLYGPDDYTPTGTYPLVVLLHGGGERADPTLTPAQNQQVLLRQAYVQAFAAPSTQHQWPCFVLVPQAPLPQRWVNSSAEVSSYTLAPQPSQSLTLVLEMVQSIKQTYPTIDPARVYVGGISMGALGTWEAVERWPWIFAAAFPIAGAGDPQAVAALKAVPIWAFQGSGDAIVPVQASRLMVQAARAAGGTVCYTEYPGAGHDIWLTQRPLSDPLVLAWLFSQTKTPSSSTAPPLACPAHG